MAENYKSSKTTAPKNKRKVGEYKTVNINSSDYLPDAFQTRINKQWLDGTLDQLVTKGQLEDIDHFVGDKTGRSKVPGEQKHYLNTGNSNIQLEPGITSATRITYDDVAQGIEQYFDDYNYNAAYGTQSYSYQPPIDVDKFLNFSSYYWVPNLPVYESDNTNGTGTYVVDPATDISGKVQHTFKDDNNEFRLENGMRIKLELGYGSENNKIYLVTGVGKEINFRLYSDIRNGVGYNVWTDESRYSNKTKGYWDSIDVLNITYNNNGTNDSRSTDPFTIITDYNTDLANTGTNTAPALWFYTDNNRKQYLSDGMVIKFDTAWPALHPSTANFVKAKEIYWVTVNSSGVTLTAIVEAVQSGNTITQSIPSGITTAQKEKAQSYLPHSWDSNTNWDTHYTPTSLKDYFMIDRDDKIATAWSRSNYWVHRDTVFKLASMNPLMDAGLFTTDEAQAKRPIIEFAGGMHLVEHGNNLQAQDWAGPVDFILYTDAQKTLVQNGNTYIVQNTNVIYKRDSTLGSDPVYYTLSQGDTFLCRSALADNQTHQASLETKFVRHDLWCDVLGGNNTKIGYTKKGINRCPLYYLYDEEDVRLDDETKYPDSTHKYAMSSSNVETGGSKIFAYAVGTGTTEDTELDMVVSLKDIGPKAEYEFVNHMHNDTFSYSLETTSSGFVETDTIKGNYSYMQYGRTKNAYIPSTIQRGAKEHIQHIVTDGSQAQEISVGHSAWRSSRKFFVYRNGASNTFTLSEQFASGVLNHKKEQQPTIIVRGGEQYTFIDLTGNLGFYTGTGSAYTTNVTTSGNQTTITMPSVGYLQYGISNTNTGTIVILASDDYLYHDLLIDGVRIRSDQYTMNANTISVPASLVNTGSIIDLEYRDVDATNDTSVYSVPEVHSHNATNEPIKAFTISETFQHWNDIIYKTPGLGGQSFGINNRHSSAKLPGIGGTIFMYDDISIMHDYTYADTSYDVRDALATQARDFDGFRKRFKAQVLRLYRANTYTATKDIVRDALKAITETRRGTDLHSDSNMVYFQDGREFKFELTSSQVKIVPSVSFDTDFNTMDHAYVYLSENNGNNQYYERLLVKGVDYTTSGSVITLTQTATAVSGTDPAFVTLQFIERSEKSYVPASMVKLGLAYAMTPQISGNRIYLHDGDELIYDGTSDLYTPTSQYYDVVNATLLDLDKRIWAGIVDLDNTRSGVAFLPGPHTDPWYTKEKLDNYTQQLYRGFAAKEGWTVFNNSNYYDASDEGTWNYSTLPQNGVSIPGHWKGAYTYLFGTFRPDLNPWHMLGYSKKPTWWDANYSWTDASKRTALINALTKGLVSNPADSIQRTDLRYARHNWDWTNKSPVTTAGMLEAQSTVLGTPTAVNAASNFVFGDWGPYEIVWRRSSQGQSALVDAVMKLVPPRGWTEFFQPGLFVHVGDTDTDKLVNRYTRRAIQPADLLYAGDSQDQKIERIRVKGSSSGWGTGTTFNLYTPEQTQHAGTSRYGIARAGKAKIDANADGKIQTITLTEGSYGYKEVPIYEVINSGTGADVDALLNVEFIMADAKFDGHGVNKAIQNNILRNYADDNFSDHYSELDTKLMQKVGGFTSEKLVDFYTESGANGKYKVTSNDYDVYLYKGPPRKLINASSMKLTKNSNGFQVNGLGLGKQKFYFYEPDRRANNFTEITLPSGVTVKRYKDFNYTAVSSVEYESEIAKVQDLYDFVRGYFEWLFKNGVETRVNGNSEATRAAVFAVDGQIGDTEDLYIGDGIRYRGTQGRLIEFGTLPGGMNSILDTNGKSINNRQYTVNRLELEAVVEIADDSIGKEFGSVTFAEVDFEHVIEFSNTTQFNDTLFNDITNQRHRRLIMQGHRTRDWNGNTKAPGYIVFDNKIVENFDTSVETINTLYDYNIENVNPNYRKAQDLTIGNYDKEWVNDTLLNDQTFAKFYQGLIKAKGTSDVMKPFNRSSMLHSGTSLAGITEEWMFRHSYYGDTTNMKAIEVRLSPNPADPDLIDNNVEVVDFAGAGSTNSIQYVNRDASEVAFNTETMAVFQDRDYRIKTAGEIIDEEENDGNIVKTLDDMKSIYDATKDYAKIETWNGTTSYKRGDKVRYKGRLVQCNVASIGFNTQASGLSFTGTVSNPVFDYVTQAGSDPASAVIDGTAIWFDETQTQFNALTATATVDADISGNEIPSGSILGIADTSGSGYNVSLTLNNIVLVSTIDTTAAESGNPFFTCQISSSSDPIIADNTGENLIINGATISLIDATSKPAGSSLTKQDVVDFINNVYGNQVDTRLTATLVTGNIVIVYDAQGSTSSNLVIGNGTANNDLNIIAGTYTPSIIQQSQAQSMNNATLASKINAHADKPTDISAAVVGNFVVITKAPTTGSSTSSTLTLSGAVQTALNFPATQTMTGSQVAVNPQTVQNARDSINAANISGVVASVSSNNNLVITSTNNSLDMGSVNNNMNQRAGFGANVSGPQATTATVVANTFNASDWTDISDSDEALFKIQVISDENPDNADGQVSGPTAIVSGIQSTAMSTAVPSVFNGYNLFQVMNTGLYSEITDPNGAVGSTCSICAGTATQDGNDACVNTNVDHNLEVGDYVMIVNSTSTPSVDGIHKVTSLGASGETRKFFIDMFIEECGLAPQIYVLRNCRFNNYDDVMKAEVNNIAIQQDLSNITNAQNNTANTPQFVRSSSIGNASGRYNWKTGDKVFTNFDDAGSVRGTYVRTFNGTAFDIEDTRTVTSRAVGKDSIKNALIYSGNKNARQTDLVLEVYDPVLRAIPGIVDVQIDFSSFVDAAGYTHSTDLNEPVVLNVSTAWGEAELGKVWWDLNNAIYYDYSQGTNEYKRDYYGKLWEGSSIDVYEWSKSTVPPQEYDELQVNKVLTKVDITSTPSIGSTLEFTDAPSNVEVFGQVATGTPYSITDRKSGEKIYYYSEAEDFNSKTGLYEKVYYFWVKNKTTYRPAPNRTMPVKNIADVIKNPTANGISWCAPIGANELLVANIQYITTHTSVLQINKETAKPAHNSWTVMQEGQGLVPEYWYLGLVDNLVGRQRSSGVAFPNENLHQYNRFGDDRDLGQGWFYDTEEARREALDCVNKALKNINLIQDLEDKWDRSIGTFKAEDGQSSGNKQVIDIDVDYSHISGWKYNKTYAMGTLVRYNKKIWKAKIAHTSGASSYAAFNNNTLWARFASIYDLSEMWDYATYVSPVRRLNELPTLQLKSKTELASVDKTKHRTVSVSIVDNDGFDRSEILRWQNQSKEWVLMEKKNSTIQFAKWLTDSSKIDSWDKNRWDTFSWDGNKMVYWHYLVEALRKDIFIERHLNEFNKFFFCMVRHCLATQNQVDWVHKTTYIQVDIATPVSKTVNKYRKGTINSLLGYINDVKPFHTKIRNVVDKNTIDDKSVVGIVEDFKTAETIKLNQFSVNQEGNNYASNALIANAYKNDVLASTFTDSTFTDYQAKVFTDSTTPPDFISGGSFIDPENYNYTTDENNNRNLLAQWEFGEDLSISVLTNTSGSTVDTNSRTFLYRQDGKLNQFVDVLESAKSTTTTSAVTNIDTSIPVTSDAVFNSSGGFAFINGEVLEYTQATNNTLTVRRGYASQKDHASGSTIVDITDDANVFTSTIKGKTANSGQIPNITYVANNLLNDITMGSDTSMQSEGTAYTVKDGGATSILSGTGRLSARMSSGTQGIDI